MKAKKSSDLESELMKDLLAESDSPPASTDKIDSSDTVRLNDSKIISTDFSKSRITSPRTLGADVALMQSENMRFAQQRISDLELETERLRRENEQLAAAGETIRRNSEDLLAEKENQSNQLADLKERLLSEREILENSLKAKDREAQNLKMKVEEFEMRLSTNLQKIRVRERELENRLELIKMESTAVVRSKDEIILDLKRQIDQLTSELENYRAKGQEMYRQMNEKQETLRRTVKALRLALSLLEGSEGDNHGGKKG